MAVTFSINNEFDVSLKVFDILFYCLNECEIDEDLLLQSAINILKEIVQFHIDAAKRERYATAAYYCSLLEVYINT